MSDRKRSGLRRRLWNRKAAGRSAWTCRHPRYPPSTGEAAPSPRSGEGNLRCQIGSDLVFVDAFGIVKQPADQRGLAVIHATRRRQAKQLLLLVLAKEIFDVRSEAIWSS